MLSGGRQRSAAQPSLHAVRRNTSVTAGPVTSVHDRDSGRVALDGWLEKKSEWRRVWGRRHVTLDGTRIAYRLEESAAEKGSGTVASVDCNTDRCELVLRVWLLEGGAWTLRAQDLGSYERWLEALLSAVAADSTAPDSATAASSDGSRNNNENGAWGPVQLQAAVEKQAAWTGRWNRRYLELSEGTMLTYRAEPGGAVRQRYTIVAVDAAVRTEALASSSHSGSMAAHVDRLLLFSTSVGERFWVKFESAAECSRWQRTARTNLQRQSSWQWQALPEDPPAARSLLPAAAVMSLSSHLLLDKNGTHNYSSLRAQFHSAAVVPMTGSAGSGGGGTGHCLLMFGGATRPCTNVFQPLARAFVPLSLPNAVRRDLTGLQLFGSHAVVELAPLPFEERPHVKVRPPALYGATLTAVYCSAAKEQLNRTSVSAVQAVLIGGLPGGAVGAVSLPNSEVWAAMLAPPSHLLADGTNTVPAPHFKPFWRRFTFPAYELPSLAFHSATVLSANAVSAGSSATRGSGEWSRTRTVLLTGGLDAELRARAECYAITWPCYRSIDETPEPPSVRFFGYLPEARAFHGTVTLADGTVVLVGGRGVGSEGVPPVLTLPPAALSESAGMDEVTNHAGDLISPWRRAQWHADQWSLPPLPDAAVAVNDKDDRVVVLAQLTSPRVMVKLFVLSFELVPDGTEMGAGGEVLPSHTMRVRWQEIALRAGAVPRSVTGASLHICNGYLYVLGAEDNADLAVDDSSFAEGASDSKERLMGPLRVLLPATLQ